MAKNRRHKQGVWWEAEKDQALTWVRYRNGWAHLFEVSLQMYGANKSSRERIQENIHTLLGVLLRRATPDDFKQFAAMITKELPGVAAVYAAWSIDELLRLKNKVEELADHSNKQGEIITHQGEAIQNESQKMSKIDAELKAIKSTRIWRYRTLVREKMGYNK